jgi:hypothetical protein
MIISMLASMHIIHPVFGYSAEGDAHLSPSSCSLHSQEHAHSAFWYTVPKTYICMPTASLSADVSTRTDVAKACQNFLIVVEMFIYAVLLHYTFSFQDFKAGVYL